MNIILLHVADCLTKLINRESENRTVVRWHLREEQSQGLLVKYLSPASQNNTPWWADGVVHRLKATWPREWRDYHIPRVTSGYCVQWVFVKVLFDKTAAEQNDPN